MRFMLFICACLASVGVLKAAEKPVSFTDEQVANAVASAPASPILQQLESEADIRLKLVDFINFADPNDFHDLVDRGSSTIVKGPAGAYRQTAAHRHALVSVRWKADAIDKPHVLVWEYPDDNQRQICFFTHESRLSGRKNIDWSLETGVNCGYPFPLSNKMQYHTFFFWPSDKYPVAMYMNWARNKVPAAASKLWVYRVQGDHLPPLSVNEPDPENPRMFGGIHNWSLVPTKGIFGLNRSTVMDHIAEYHAFRGDNIISWPVVSNNTWGFRCKIPSWDGGDGRDTHELEQILAACEKHNIKFMPVFNTGFKFKMQGKTDAEVTKEQRRAAIEQGFKEFMQRYGTSKALYGLAFETQDLSPQYTECSLDQYKKSFGSLKAFREAMKEIAPNLELFHYLGGKNIHSQYFYDGAGVFARWEENALAWEQHLANEVEGLWTSWGRNPKELNEDGIHTVLSYQSDDYRIFDTYYQNPRAMTYWDLESSKPRADLFDTRKALIWNTFYEGYIGLVPENWLYRKVWVAPDFNPAGPHALAAWMQSMQHRDRDMLLFGAWNNKGAGNELAMRRLAKAFRSLPPGELKDVAVLGTSPVTVRRLAHKGQTYISCINHTAFTQELSINNKAMTIPAYSMETKILSGVPKLSVQGNAAEDYVAWIDKRMQRFVSTKEQLVQLDKQAVPSVYNAHFNRVQGLFNDKQYYQADMCLGFGIQEEINLRLSVLQPKQIRVPKIAAQTMSQELDTQLDNWPKQASDIRTDSSHIGTHLFFPNDWEGSEDLSARIRLCHDDVNLYVGLHINDQTLNPKKDSCKVYFSPANYLKYKENKESYEANMEIPILHKQKEAAINGAYAAKGRVVRHKSGYIAVFKIALKDMPLDDKRIGFLLMCGDDDFSKHLNNNTWARKQVLLYPNEPNFAYWADARTCVQMILE